MRVTSALAQLLAGADVHAFPVRVYGMDGVGVVALSIGVLADEAATWEPLLLPRVDGAALKTLGELKVPSEVADLEKVSESPAAAAAAVVATGFDDAGTAHAMVQRGGAELVAASLFADGDVVTDTPVAVQPRDLLCVCVASHARHVSTVETQREKPRSFVPRCELLRTAGTPSPRRLSSIVGVATGLSPLPRITRFGVFALEALGGLPVVAPYAPDGLRQRIHNALMLPNRPCLHATQDLLRCEASTVAAQPGHIPAAWTPKLVDRVHDKVPLKKPRTIPNSTTAIVRGAYDYYHYKLDGFDDCGWGCAYRSLQTVLSWFQRAGGFTDAFAMPDIRRIQEILARVDPDKAKQAKFVGSSTWIGSIEVMLVLQHFMPHLECVIQRLEKGSELDESATLHRMLLAHFERGGCPVMIGGASYAHTIVGIDCNVRTASAQYLIVDPHYPAERTDVAAVGSKGWCGWKEAKQFFDQKSWYNVCIPRVASPAVSWA